MLKSHFLSCFPLLFLFLLFSSCDSSMARVAQNPACSSHQALPHCWSPEQGHSSDIITEGRRGTMSGIRDRELQWWQAALERVMEEFTHAAVATLQCLLQNALSAFNLLYVFKTWQLKKLRGTFSRLGRFCTADITTRQSGCTLAIYGKLIVLHKLTFWESWSSH